MAKTFAVTKGYSIPRREHMAHMSKIKRGLPEALKAIPSLSQRFTGKPQFFIEQKGPYVHVIREDHAQKLSALVHTSEDYFTERLTVSEWKSLVWHWGKELDNFQVTMHDVYEHQGITVKTGNPYRNNSWEEFYLALFCRAQGIVEAKSPIGFVFWRDDPYGIERPGRMFYKHLDGMDLQDAIKTKDRSMLNWALWETGKFFSRLVRAGFVLTDPHRLGNFFIEQAPSTKVLRFLDLENMYHRRTKIRETGEKMVSDFIKTAMETGFINEETLGEFKIVCGCFGEEK